MKLTKQFVLRRDNKIHTATVNACTNTGNVRVVDSSDVSLIGADHVALAKWTQTNDNALLRAEEWVTATASELIDMIYRRSL